MLAMDHLLPVKILIDLAATGFPILEVRKALTFSLTAQYMRQSTQVPITSNAFSQAVRQLSDR